MTLPKDVVAAESAPVFSVSDFVAVLNQTLEFAYPSVIISGELANFRVSKNRWVYFDLKDELATVKFFGTVYQLPGPLEDGMVLKVRGMPRLHPQYGFSVTIQTIQPSGEGTIRRAAELLEAKLAAEGLFEESRKRPLPYPPERIGLVTSHESAAFADFVKILNARWRGIGVELIDVQVQGEAASEQISHAIEQFNQVQIPPEVLVIIRGGGSAEDLQAFSTEQVTRAVAASRIPTLVAIGHETDISLAELAADRKASTPSNAAEMLVPDRSQVLQELNGMARRLDEYIRTDMRICREDITSKGELLNSTVAALLHKEQEILEARAQLLYVLSPQAVLRRGYALVRDRGGKLIRSGKEVAAGMHLNIEISDAVLQSNVVKIQRKEKYHGK